MLSGISRAWGPAILLAVAAVLYGFGSILFTQAFNLPLNQGLAARGVPALAAAAAGGYPAGAAG